MRLHRSARRDSGRDASRCGAIDGDIECGRRTCSNNSHADDGDGLAKQKYVHVAVPARIEVEGSRLRPKQNLECDDKHSFTSQQKTCTRKLVPNTQTVHIHKYLLVAVCVTRTHARVRPVIDAVQHDCMMTVA